MDLSDLDAIAEEHQRTGRFADHLLLVHRNVHTALINAAAQCEQDGAWLPGGVPAKYTGLPIRVDSTLPNGGWQLIRVTYEGTDDLRPDRLETVVRAGSALLPRPVDGITYRVGDATDPPERPGIIAHVCNNAGRWGAGFVLAVSRRWAQPETSYRTRYRRAALRLGCVHAVEVEDGLWVANMIAQEGVRCSDNPQPLRIWALRECLRIVAERAVALGAVVHMPRIGCGLAGGSWSFVEPVVADAMSGVPVIVYDLPPVPHLGDR